jgi:hypothetical protein
VSLSVSVSQRRHNVNSPDEAIRRAIPVNYDPLAIVHGCNGGESGADPAGLRVGVE